MKEISGSTDARHGGIKEAYLSVIDLTCTEQSLERVISWNEEACKVHKEFAGNVEEDQEKVNSGEAEESVDLGHGSLLLKVVEHGILGELHYGQVSQIES